MCIKGHYRIICIKYVVVKNRFHLHLLNIYKAKVYYYFYGSKFIVSFVQFYL